MSLYTKGQLVWAKIKGYPWWPGVIAETNLDKNGKIEKEILVNFIGENSHAVLTQDKVADFTEKEKQYSKSKNKKLQESIEIAQRILNREVTYEEERQKLLREAERIQASINEDKPKQGNRGRPSLKKKLEVRAESTPTEKDDEVLSNAKETAQKEKEKGLLYSFNEDVLGLHKKKSSPEREKDTETEHAEKANPKVFKQDQDSRLVQKLKLKEKEREKKHDREAGDYHDYLPFKITRVKIERDPSDADMESASKSNNRKKTLNSDSSRISRKETSTTSDTKHTKDIQEVSDEPAKIKARLLIDDDDLLSGYQNSHIPPCFNDKQEEEYTESPTKPSERRLSEKMEFEEEKESHKSLNFETNASRNTNDSKMTTNSHVEPTKTVQVHHMHSVSPVENNLNNLSMNNKRPVPDIVKDTVATEKVTKGVIGETESKEYPSKKVKLASTQSVEEEKELDEKVLGSEVYNVLLIKKFEDNLRRILDKLSNKLQGVDRLKEYDVDMIKILEVIEEFESRAFDGSEFIGSDLGKILKTVHYLLITHKHKLPKTGDLVIIALAKVLHKIKDKIIKFCMDNTEYVDALHLPRPKPNPTTITAIDIDFEEIKAKMEEIGTESKPDVVPITTKIEEESTSSYSQVQKQSVQVNDINVLKQPAIRASVQQATTALPHYAGIKEISTENNKENHMVKPNELHVNDLNLLLRKKICQKLAKLLQRSYLIDRDRSQKMTLLVEDKLNKFYVGNVSDYKQAIKGLHKLIKVQMLREDELTNILTLSLQQFQQLLREKLSKMNAARGSTHYNDASPIDYDDQLKNESQFPNQENSNFDFNTYLNPKANNVLISKDKLRKKSGGEVRQKMIIEDSNPLISNFIQTKQEDES